jgi:hypothetical protein
LKKKEGSVRFRRNTRGRNKDRPWNSPSRIRKRTQTIVSINH